MQAAHDTVHQFPDRQAVADSDLPGQTDQLKAREQLRILACARSRSEQAVDHGALLAGTLGITVDELGAAQTAAHEAALADALANGKIARTG
ncbi:MAG: hypothetical protein R2867_31500 [Caldilineaceae bacterium]